jgi:hypothetical protein
MLEEHAQQKKSVQAQKLDKLVSMEMQKKKKRKKIED